MLECSHLYTDTCTYVCAYVFVCVCVLDLHAQMCVRACVCHQLSVHILCHLSHANIQFAGAALVVGSGALTFPEELYDG